MSPRHLARLTERDPHAEPRPEPRVVLNLPAPQPTDPRLEAMYALWTEWELPLPYTIARDLIQDHRDHYGTTLPDYPHYLNHLQPQPAATYRLLPSADPRLDHPFTRHIATNATRWCEDPAWMAVLGVEALRQALDLPVPDWPYRTDPRP